MKRFLTYLLVGVSLRFFSRFQETLTFKDGVVIFASKLYTQTVGIELAAAVILFVVTILVWTRRVRFVRLRDVDALGAGIFCLPALFNNWNMSRFGGGGYITETTSGFGGPLATSLFVASAVALIVTELYMRCGQRSRNEEL